MKTLALVSLWFALTLSASAQKKAAIAFSFAATVADIETSHHSFVYSGCSEQNMLSPWKRPTRLQMYSFNLPVAALAAWWDIRRGRKGKRAWIASTMNGGAHVAGLAYSAQHGCIW